MKDNRLLSFSIAIAVPILILVFMTITPLATRIYGTEILLLTQPVDPRDVFRGDYVDLKYEISSVTLEQLPVEIINTKHIEEHRAYRGEIIKYEYYDTTSLKDKKLYAVLKKYGEYYVVDYISLEKPKDKLFLNCKMSYCSSTSTKDTKFTVDYSMDKYYVPENTGTDLENKSRAGELTAKVKVRDGYAQLIQVY